MEGAFFAGVSGVDAFFFDFDGSIICSNKIRKS